MLQFIAFMVACPALASQDDAARLARDLVDKLRSEKIDEREQAARKLKDLGKQALPELEKAAKGSDAEVAARAAFVLRAIKLREALSPNLLSALPGVEDRLAAGDEGVWAEVLIEVGRRLPRLRDDLEVLAPAALRGATTLSQQMDVVRIVGQYRVVSGAPELGRIMRDSTAAPDVRSFAVRTLANIDLKTHFKSFLELLKDPCSQVSGSVADVLKRPEARDFLPQIRPLLKDELPHVRVAALGAVTRHGGAGAFEEILPFLDDSDARVRLAALLALGDTSARDRAPKLARSLNDRSPFIRATAAYVLSKLEAREAVPDLEKALRDPAPYVRFQAAYALHALAREQSEEALLPLLADPDRGIRLQVSQYLLKMAWRKAAPVLLEAAGEESIAFKWEKEEATDVVGVGYPAPRLSALNALKEPAAWDRFSRSTLSKAVSGTPAQVVAEVASEAGMDAATLPAEMVKDGRRLTVSKETLLPEALNQVLGRSFEIIFDGGKLRVVTLDEARSFWRSWWKEEENK